MEDTELIQRLVAVEEARKSNTKRIDEHDEQIKELQNTYKIMEKMDYRIGNVEENIEKINTKLDESSQEKGKKWDKLIDYIFYSILGLLLSFIAFKLGIK